MDVGDGGGTGLPRPTRRRFLHGAGQLGAMGVVLALLGGERARAATPEPVRGVLHGRVMHDAAADFGAGRRVGIALPAAGEHRLRAIESAATYESAVLPLPFAATHVGLRWTAGGRGSSELAFSVRSSPDGRDWSAWMPLTVAGARAGEDGSEGHSALARLPRGAFVQYRVAFPAETGAWLRRLQVSYLNPYDGPERPLAEPSGWPRPPFPFPFRSRDQWGADESLRFTATGAESWPRMYVPVKKLVVHHTATTNDYTDAAAEVRAIYVFHAKELDWGDIGYHALIGRDGVVYEGRRGRGPARDPGVREAMSPGVVGGHAFFHNFGTAGYALIGTFVDTPLPALMRQRLIELLVYQARWHGVDPRTLGDFLRNDGIWHRDVPNVSGHRDLVVTECPGNEVYRLLPDLRAEVAERLGGARASEAARVKFWSAPAAADTTLRTATAEWAGLGAPLPGAGYSYYLEYWRRDGPYDIVPPDNGPGWRPYDAATGTALAELIAGNYTLHVRGRDGLGHEAVYETHTSFRVTDELLADDEDLGQTRRTGRWVRRTDGKGILGESWEEAAPGGGESAFRWQPLVAEAGEYEVWVRWPEIAGLASNAPYSVAHAGGVFTERRDQRSGGGEWTRLGGERVFRLGAGRGGGVTLTNDADGPVAADAVKLVLRAGLATGHGG
jgi:hypothetical protein